MVSAKYKEAMAEVLCVLKHCDKQVISKIPLEVIKNIKENASELEGVEEKFEGFHDDISTLQLRQETIALLAVIYRKYLCTDEERIEFDKNLSLMDELLYKDRVSMQFNTETVDNSSKTVMEQNLPKEVKKESFLIKLINKITAIFHK